MKNTNQSKTLLSQIYTKNIFNNIVWGNLLLIYSLIITNVDIKIFFPFVLTIVGLILFSEFVLCPFTNYLIMGKTSRLLEEFETREFTLEERTDLFLKVHKISKKNGISAFSYFLFCAVILNLGYFIFVKVDIFLCLISFITCCFGAYIISLVEYSISKKVCTDFACKIAAKGIDKNLINKKKIFGTTYEKTFVLFCIVPVILSVVVFILVYICYNHCPISSQTGRGFIFTSGTFKIQTMHLYRLVSLLVINILISIISVYSFLTRILASTKLLQSSMNNIINNDIFTVNLLPTDYENEVSYNIALVNQIIEMFRGILFDINKIGKKIIEPIGDLTEISQTTATTSLEQATAVKEILATMEETDSLTREIAKKIDDVTNVTEITAQNVQNGFNILNQNLDKMNEITEANVSTITGIKDLSEKIGSIWDIVKIINDIAEQTRIIAFNAELESSTAGESGKNFHIVANEVRRLADGITNSINQIKDRIQEIQHSSDSLIITSESGTEKIKEGLELSNLMKEKFTEIQKSSEITVDSTVQIKDIIYQQSKSFDQIVSTVRQISSGIENFSTSTNTENETAQKLKRAAEDLQNLHSIIGNL